MASQAADPPLNGETVGGGKEITNCNYCEVQAKTTSDYTISPATKVCGACSTMKYWCDTCIKGHHSLYTDHVGYVGNYLTKEKKGGVNCTTSVDKEGSLVVKPAKGDPNTTTIEDVITSLLTGKQSILENSEEVVKTLQTHHKSAVLEIKEKFSKECDKACEEADALLKSACSLVHGSTAARITGYDGAMYKLSTYADYLAESDETKKAKSDHHGKKDCVVKQLASETFAAPATHPKVKLAYFGSPAHSPHTMVGLLESMKYSIADFSCDKLNGVVPSYIASANIKDCYRLYGNSVVVAAGHLGLFWWDAYNSSLTKLSDDPCWGVCRYKDYLYVTTYHLGKILVFKFSRGHGWGYSESLHKAGSFQVEGSKCLSGISAFQGGRLAIADEKLQRITVHDMDGIKMVGISLEVNYIQMEKLIFPRSLECQGNNILYVHCKDHVLKITLDPTEIQWSCGVAHGNNIKVIGSTLFVCQSLGKGGGLMAVDAETGEIKGPVDLPDIGTSEVISVTEATWCKSTIPRIHVNIA